MEMIFKLRLGKCIRSSPDLEVRLRWFTRARGRVNLVSQNSFVLFCFFKEIKTFHRDTGGFCLGK